MRHEPPHLRLADPTDEPADPAVVCIPLEQRVAFQEGMRLGRALAAQRTVRWGEPGSPLSPHAEALLDRMALRLLGVVVIVAAVLAFLLVLTGRAG